MMIKKTNIFQVFFILLIMSCSGGDGKSPTSSDDNSGGNNSGGETSPNIVVTNFNIVKITFKNIFKRHQIF